MPDKPAPQTREEWEAGFAHAMMDLRPEVGAAHAYRVARHEWGARRGVVPTEAAKQWAAEQDARRTERKS